MKDSPQVMAGDAETVRGWFEEIGGRLDAAGLTDWYENTWHEDISWRAIEGAPDDFGVMHGRARVRTHLEELQEAFEEIVLDPIEIADLSEFVMVELRLTARSRAGGVPTEIRYWVLYRLRDGKAAWVREYASRDEAIAAASLPAQ